MSFTWLATGSRLTRSKNAESRSTAWNSRASAEASSGSPGRGVTAVAVPGQQGSDGDRRLASMTGSFRENEDHITARESILAGEVRREGIEPPTR